MGRYDGFIRVRQSLADEVASGHMTALSFAVFLVIMLQADYRTGVWLGSAAKLVALDFGDCALKSIKRSLQSLEQRGFLKRFHVQGRRCNYFVAVNGYIITDGAMKGLRLNAEKSTDCEHLIYDHVPDNDPDVGLVRGLTRD